MARVFVTGSSTGLGLLAARWLDDRGHEVTLHARSAERTDEPRAALPRAALVQPAGGEQAEAGAGAGDEDAGHGVRGCRGRRRRR